MQKKLVYSTLKPFYFPEKLQSLPIDTDEIRPPMHVRIKPTNVCNQHCYYCSYADNELQLGDDMVFKDKMPKEKLLEIIDDLEEMGVGAVTFSGGGEPMVYPHITEVLQRIVSTKKLKLAFISNGSHMNGEKLELIADHASWVRISIDGWDDASYAKYRGVNEGRWTEVMNNIGALAKTAKKCRIGIYVILDKDNAPHIYDMIKKYKDLGVRSVKIYGVVLSDDFAKNHEYHMQFFNEAKERIARAKADFESDDFQVHDAYDVDHHDYSKTYDWCPYAQITPVIGADMNVYSCHDKAYTEKGMLGNIATQRFRDFWMNNKQKFFNINPSRDCNHHCMVDPQNRLILEYLDIYPDHLEFT